MDYFNFISYQGCGLFKSPHLESANQAPPGFSFLRVLTMMLSFFESRAKRLYCKGILTTCSFTNAPNVPAPTIVIPRRPYLKKSSLASWMCPCIQIWKTMISKLFQKFYIFHHIWTSDRMMPDSYLEPIIIFTI